LGAPVFEKSEETYKTNKVMKKYPTIFQKCGVAVLVRFRTLEWAW